MKKNEIYIRGYAAGRCHKEKIEDLLRKINELEMCPDLLGYDDEQLLIQARADINNGNNFKKTEKAINKLYNHIAKNRIPRE